MTRVIVAALASLFLCLSVWASNYAWWLTVQINPKGAFHDGVPVGTLTTPLKALTLLSCNNTTATFSAEQCEEVDANGARFEVVGDFNNNRHLDGALHSLNVVFCILCQIKV